MPSDIFMNRIKTIFRYIFSLMYKHIYMRLDIYLIALDTYLNTFEQIYRVFNYYLT